ncbi:caspase recruitment domain-containing protein 9 [Sturnira hondurensis]|uniref:caspase recruitment domain-containing protein 9 n=1 Tax=Sturnira hondurensis TaxID=192404 RepID=UPI00187A961A|nr:caspase recruitment domain-containing protein 9 [Sturnira hondurensis]XP_036892563.1 caspase recruitment domain-containing protein 9 [Sturnira hondurensis]
MSDYENEDECWSTLEGFRVKLISVIDPSRITPYLRQCKVLNPDDEEQVLSDPNLVIRKRKVGVLLDILQRTGHKGYVAFLESLELYYPQLYRKVTGKEPSRVFSMIIDASGESGLTQLLMSEVSKLQKKVQDLTALLSSKDDFIKELRVKDSLLRKHQERVQKLKEDCEACSRELKRCKDENYDLAMRLARQSEEKGAALMRNRDLQLEVDRLKHSLMKAEDDCKVERKHTLKLRHAMEQRPSQELLWELQQEKAQLQARVQELEASVQDGRPDKGSPYIQVLEEDWRQALRDHQEQATTIFALRKDLRQSEALRARCAEEKEVFELQCLALRKDSKMYKDRIEAILLQMEEVAIERDQAISSREELHTQYARSLQDKDVLRKRVRELSEKADELQLQLFQCEGQLLAVEGRLKQQQLEMLLLSSDLEDSSPRNSQELSIPRDLEEDTQLSDKGGLPDPESPEQPFEALQKECLSLTPNGAGLSGGEPPEKERRRLKESFENYRRKRALRKLQHGTRQGEVDWENTTGSDNTDTEGS